MPPKPAPLPSSNCAPALGLDHFRKLAGISLDEIAASTKISLRFLRAIEAGEYSQLPGGIFTTSYLRQYAAAIGYDESALLEHYQRKMNPQPLVEPKLPARETRNRLDRWFGITAQESR
ncbi:MAG TPA: helix-turn-helix domain-containing protein [Bryobacteraceae bacterium]|nr:helix-turn-helix domain-containing protein [Bryobacteraceae bacterium]